MAAPAIMALATIEADATSGYRIRWAGHLWHFIGGGFFIANLRISAIVLATMVIRMRHTRSHTGNRRSHHALKAATLSKCSHCGEAHRPHHMCLECGYYNGRQVMDLATEKTKRDARIKAKNEVIKNSLGLTDEKAPEAKEEPKKAAKKDAK
jgi:large subunit ribosomal protein L32